MANRFGGWEIKLAIGILPQKLTTAFFATNTRISGAQYQPLLYCG
jgi:hypothetical protein